MSTRLLAGIHFTGLALLFGWTANAETIDLGGLLSDPEVINDQNRFRNLSMEYAQLDPVVSLFREFEQARADREAAEDMLRDEDEELRKALNEAIAEIMENGTYEKIRSQYFDFDIMVQPIAASELFK